MRFSGLTALEHGGRLAQASERYQRPIEQWLDLSTGISPWSWPVPDIPAALWQQLPDDDDELESIAQNYYQSQLKPLALPGSQWLIRQLPRFLNSNAAVAMPKPAYAEHVMAWQSQGFEVVFYQDKTELELLLEKPGLNLGYVLVINPNNPTAQCFTAEYLHQLEQTLARRKGLLVVDEAFADSQPERSLLACSALDNAVVLRSLGKFFGLAGARLGFGFLPGPLFDAVNVELRPWAVAHPSRYIASLCLQDLSWQTMQRQRLKNAAENLYQALQSLLLLPGATLGFSDYFISLTAQRRCVEGLYDYLMEQGIYIRRFEPENNMMMLRFGLCKPEQLDRLQQAINHFGVEHDC